MRIAVLLVMLCGSVYSQKTGLATYAIPSPATLGIAGTVQTDPTFGTLVMRLTDVNTSSGRDCYHEYSQVDAFSKDSRKITVNCTGDYGNGSGNVALWFEFDPINFTLGTKHSFPTDPAGTAVAVGRGALWSRTDPESMFVFNSASRKIWLLNVNTGVYSDGAGHVDTPIKTFSLSDMPTDATILIAYNFSDDDSVFMFGGLSNAGDQGSFVWKRSTDTILWTVSELETAHNSMVDKTGLWAYRGRDDNSAKILRNLSTSVSTDLTVTYGYGHDDMGSASMCAISSSGSSTRNLTRFSAPTTLVAITPLSASDGHMSARNDSNDTCTMEYYRSPETGGQMNGEVWSTFSDGSFRTLRYAHHQSVPATNYRSQPQAVISRDSQFITYNSNNGVELGRIDVFVVKAPRKSATTTSVGVTVF